MKSLLLIILILALPFSLAVEMCVYEGQADYVCFDRLNLVAGCSAYGNNFNQCCLQEFGGTVKTGTTIPECNEVCCCDGTFALQDDPMSQSRCQEQRVGNSNIQILASATSCDAVCASGSSGTTKVMVSGTVTADGATLEGVTVTHPSGLVDITNAQGRYNIYAVPATPSTSFTASYPGCQESTQTIDLSSGTDATLSFTLNCNGGPTCTPTSVSDTRVVTDQATGASRITWTPDTCAQVTGYVVYRCSANGNSCTGVETPIGGIPIAQAGTFIDANVPSDTDVCYLVKPRLADGTQIAPTQSDGSNCLGAVSSICLVRNIPQPSCFNGDNNIRPFDATQDPFYGSAHCNAGSLVLDEECDNTQGEFCMMTGNGPTCVQDNICDECNGPYGWFVDSQARSSATMCLNLGACVLDNAAYSQNTYVSCAQMSSCYDYRTKGACEGSGIDQCRVSDGPCLWQSTPGLEEIGAGICSPQNPLPGSSQCERCDDRYGFCNTQLCSTMGNCYYNAKTDLSGFGESVGCLSKDEMACAFYDDQQSCGGQVQINVQYSGNSRSGGSNAILTRSSDIFGFGLCSWNAGSCMKDANGNNAGVDDCLEAGASGVTKDCFIDTISPITTIPLWDGIELTLNQLLTITPGVSDNLYTLSRLQTKASLVPASSPPCYPDDDFAALDIVWPGESAFTLYYYSWDPAGNLEPIKSVNLFLPGEGGSSSVRLISANVVNP